MNISPILLRFTDNRQKVNSNFHNYTDNRLLMPKYNHQLSKDTVSFQAATYSNAIFERIEHDYIKVIPRLSRIATSFLDATQAVANKFMEYGVSFEREMFESTAVKSAKSKLSKIFRRKSLEERDPVRTTLFVKNPYDLSILFDKIIPEYGPGANRIYTVARINIPVGDLMKRGYVPIDEVNYIKKFFEIPHDKDSHGAYFRELKKLNYDYDDTKKLLAEFLKTDKAPSNDDLIEIAKTLKKNMPDIDIRLNKDMIDKSTIPEEYKYCVGEPHGSYEDIQIRFERTIDKAKAKGKTSNNAKPIYHELLIHFGPTYNRNAWKEHEWVYEPLRLFDELSIPAAKQVSRYVDCNEFPEQGVAKYMSDILTMFRTKVSEKLISNGKNKDYYGKDEFDEIFFTEKDYNNFQKTMGKLKYYLKRYYEQMIAKVGNSSEMAVEQLKKDKATDIRIINKVWADLEKTIDNINYDHGIQEK